MKFFFTMPLLISCLAVVGLVQAETINAEKKEATISPNQKKLDAFNMLDTNNDNGISFDEFYKGKKQKELKRQSTQADDYLSRCDKNKNGLIAADEVLSSDELKSKVRSYDDTFSFDKDCVITKESIEIYDTNLDGFISRKELLGSLSDKSFSPKQKKTYLKNAAKERQKLFKFCDTDFDGILTWKEAFSMNCDLTLSTEQFVAYDFNQDDLLTIQEIGAVVKPVHYRFPMNKETLKERAAMPPQDQLVTNALDCDFNDDHRLSRSEASNNSCKQDMAFFEQIDFNQDGFIESKELERMDVKKDYDKIDKNKDKVLDQSEFLKSKSAYVENLLT